MGSSEETLEEDEKGLKRRGAVRSFGFGRSFVAIRGVFFFSF